jgi:5-methylcytosine-specific restriction protein A
MALKKLCRCGKVIDYNQTYCNECEKTHRQERAASNKHYDKYTRDKSAAAFYNSPEWIKTREYTLAKYKGLDLYAFFILNKIVYADTVHHIVELKENWDRRLDVNNLFPLSSSNHNAIHTMYEKDKEGTQRLLFNLLDRWEKEMGKG